jgi:hypothetical protein
MPNFLFKDIELVDLVIYFMSITKVVVIENRTVSAVSLILLILREGDHRGASDRVYRYRINTA